MKFKFIWKKYAEWVLFSCYFKNKMNLCKSILLWYIGRIIDSYTTCTWICFASNVYYSCSRVAEFLTYNDSFRDIPEEAFFSGLGLVPVFPFFLLFPLPALFNANPRHQRVFRCVRCSTWAVANPKSFFFIIETEHTNINWK